MEEGGGGGGEMEGKEFGRNDKSICRKKNPGSPKKEEIYFCHLSS